MSYEYLKRVLLGIQIRILSDVTYLYFYLSKNYNTFGLLNNKQNTAWILEVCRRIDTNHPANYSLPTLSWHHKGHLSIVAVMQNVVHYREVAKW